MSIVLTPTAARLKLAKIIAAEAAAQVITVATNASPSVITIAGHGYKVGDVLFIVGATGNTAINGQRKVATVPTVNTFTCTDFFSGAAVNGNGVLGGSPTAQRLIIGLTVDDLTDLVDQAAKTPYGAGRVKDSSRPSATLETTLQTVFGA